MYRLPSAPLRAEFLSFHSLQPVPLAATHLGALKAGDVAQAASANSHGVHILPMVGLRCKVPKVRHCPMQGYWGILEEGYAMNIAGVWDDTC
jgi:hypothetical protein